MIEGGLSGVAEGGGGRRSNVTMLRCDPNSSPAKYTKSV
jgi:hypothetical protein